jgi:hypothetical protein
MKIGYSIPSNQGIEDTAAVSGGGKVCHGSGGIIPLRAV